MNIAELAKQASMNRERCYDMDEFLVLYTKLVLEEAAKVCDDMSKTEANMNKSWRNGCSDSAATIRNLIK